MFSSATQPPRPPRPNFVVSTITFEGFKLHSSNLTHALLIQQGNQRWQIPRPPHASAWQRSPH